MKAYSFFSVSAGFILAVKKCLCLTVLMKAYSFFSVSAGFILAVLR